MASVVHRLFGLGAHGKEPRMKGLSVNATNFRAIKHLAFAPSGTCLLAGANGAGKTTTLDVFRFLRALFELGHESAFAAVEESHFRRRDAANEEPVTIAVTVGDIEWRLQFPMSDAGPQGAYGETLTHRGATVLHRAIGQTDMPLESRCCAKRLWERSESRWMAPLVLALTEIRVYGAFSLHPVQRPAPLEPSASFLDETGKNLWSVLANWKSAPIRHRGRFDWVVARAQEAFPDLMGSIEIDRGLPFLFPPGAKDPAQGLPPSRAADGLLMGLLHLTAVAGAQPHSLLAFDETKSQLHPHALRSLLKAMREQAAQRDLTIIVTSHSPVVMNAFRDEPQHVFVLQPDADRTPVPLIELHDEDWLAAVSLGDLYDRLDFAAPRAPRRAE